MEIKLMKQLFKLMKSFKITDQNANSGDIYGLIDSCNSLYVICLCSSTHQLQHDPTLLISSSFCKLGTFVIGPKDYKPVFSLQGKEIALSYCQDEVEVFIYDEDSQTIVKSNYGVFEENILIENFILARTCFDYEFMCGDKTADVKQAVNNFKEEVTSNSAFFSSRDFQLLLQSKSGDDNQIVLKGKENFDSNFKVGDLFNKSSKKKMTVNNFDILTFELLLNKSSTKSYAPIVKIDSNKVKYIRTSLSGENVTYILKSLPLAKVGKCLASSLSQHIQLAEFWLIKQLQDSSLLSPLQSYTLSNYIVGHMLTPIYPTGANEDNIKEYRMQIHKALLFPLDKPIVKKLNKFYFPGERGVRILVNPHMAIQKPEAIIGEVSVVKGSYEYCHYMQDKFDDNKWGCAYRSLQTLVSWFRLQGYTDKPNPSHKQIQQILVDIKDKPSTFVGSKQWIGSMEVGFVLESLLNISSKYINVSSGTELASIGRELSYHFDSAGTPIMIGGGVFAHTIIGVDWNSDTGDIRFLILDPHYTGGEDLNVILKQGWVGWKGPDFWNPKAYYNLCLPQPPRTF